MWPDLSAWDPGTWEAFGTNATTLVATGALVAALVANGRTRKLLNIEQERRAEQIRTDRQGEAAQVSAWIPIQERSQDANMATMTDPHLVYPDLMVSNSARTPMYEVELYVWCGASSKPYYWLNLPVLPPHADAQVACNFLAQPSAIANLLMDANAVSILFKDSAGIAWHRTKSGALLEAADKKNPESEGIRNAIRLGELPKEVRADLAYPADRGEGYRHRLRQQWERAKSLRDSTDDFN